MMHLGEIGLGVMDWMNLEQCRAVVNIRLPRNTGKLNVRSMTPASQQGSTSVQLLSNGPHCFSVQRDRRLTEQDIPGPGPALPILGTRWIYSVFGPYKMNKIHEACRGEYSASQE